MKQFDQFGLAEYYQTFEQVKVDLEQKIQEYQQMYDTVLRKLMQIREILPSNWSDFSFEPVLFSCIVPFNYTDREKTLRYVKNPSLYVRYWDTNDLATESRGIIRENGSNEPALWENTSDKT
ncbi:hypothetical protein HMPREF9624_01344 [Oribacterium asaccharolyticum ACB7]|uniref:Uncharacterized protein n=1 Tax=Oribacterium asaccharolyticum ACB7 TaxID=796944 RepID=G9WWX0_9FIRM|nr:hypothetical protein [Oribacterium asaccharolyticum]EHL09303.1 hypothetical protein HMPREF9624_01344 [Oribacterium asaccharolyticum ACB7]